MPLYAISNCSVGAQLPQTVHDQPKVLRELCRPRTARRWLAEAAVAFEWFLVTGRRNEYFAVGHGGGAEAGEKAEAIGSVNCRVSTLATPEFVANVFGIQRHQHALYAAIAVGIAVGGNKCPNDAAALPVGVAGIPVGLTGLNGINLPARGKLAPLMLASDKGDQ